jgi:hypothetical protein
LKQKEIEKTEKELFDVIHLTGSQMAAYRGLKRVKLVWKPKYPPAFFPCQATPLVFEMPIRAGAIAP